MKKQFNLWLVLPVMALTLVTVRAVDLPGPKTNGSVLLPNQWSLRPAGKQVPLGDFPVNIAVHPDGRYAAVLHSGHGAHDVKIVDLTTAQVVSTVTLNEAFYGLEFSHAGGRLYCSGSSNEVVHVFDFKDGKLTLNCDIAVCDAKLRGIPAGMAVSANARDLYVANVWGQCVSRINLSTRTNVLDFVPVPGHETEVKRKPQVEALNPPDPDLDATTKRDEAQLDTTSPDAPFPYACKIDDKRQTLYVSLWGRSAVAVVDMKTSRVTALWPTQEHPTEMVLAKNGRFLYVANANRNTITVINTEKGKTVETLFASFSPKLPPGTTPSSLALSPDGDTLYVANSCNNNVAVFDVSVGGKSRSLGFIPVGWYPTSVRVTPDGKHLLVANGKGLISHANPDGPVPGQRHRGKEQNIDELFPGTLSIIDLPSGKAFRKQLAEYTRQAYLCTPRDSVPQVTPGEGNPIPAAVGKTSPIKHCIYIVKENRTYDQLLGDMKEGNGDPALCLFPEKVSPNHHKLAREFVLLDNFYVDAEVSADGHEWSMGANATDFVEKMWPLNYRRARKIPFPAEGRFPIADPAGGYLWDCAKAAGLTYRSYGEFTFNGKTPDLPGFTREAGLKGHFDPYYHGFDTDYLDQKRAQRFIEEFHRFESEGELPSLIIIRLPNDHTSGSVVGRPTPNAYVADNDTALGQIVDVVSHSKFWSETAIFILEDDAQNGPDHIDAHRSPAFVVSPYTRKRGLDSTMYSTSSMLRTIELILGLKPMTQYDASATPMFKVFLSKADTRPYEALASNIDLNEKNTAMSWGHDLINKSEFAHEDATDDRLLNEIIWRSVRGPDSPMPAPTRAAFVYAQPVDND